MTGLFSLSNELLVHIFQVSDSIQDALLFSTANRQLHAVWLEHRDPILESILRSFIPAYEIALETAVVEAQLRLSMNSKPSLRGCVPTLLRNADLCASAHTSCVAFMEENGSNAPSPATYHILRRMMLAQEFPELRDDLLVFIQATPEKTIDDYFEYLRFLNDFADDAEQARQGMLPDKKYPDAYKDVDDEMEDGWDYAHEVLCTSINERYRPYGDLPKAVYCQFPFNTMEWRADLPAAIQGYTI